VSKLSVLLQVGESVSCLAAISPSYFRDCGTAFAVCTTLMPLHAMIRRRRSTVMPDGRNLGIFTHIGVVRDNKEFAHSVPA
jgi:hypothetical protein